MVVQSEFVFQWWLWFQILEDLVSPQARSNDKSKEVGKKVSEGKTHKFAGESPKVPQIQEIEDDVSHEILDDLSPKGETRNMTRQNGVYLEKQKRKPDSIIGSNEGFKAMKPSSGTKKPRAMQMASSFKSKNPFFMVLMNPSYVLTKHHLNIPANVTEKYFLRDHGYINLLVSNGQSWCVKYIRYNTRYRNGQIVHFTTGWKEFVQDNKLVVGNVCVFEMINGSEFSLQVVIFRACKDANSHQLMKRPTIEESDDVSVEILEKTSVHCPGPQKMSTEPRGAQSNEVKLEKPKRKLDMSSKQDLADEGLGDGCMTSSKKRLKFGIPEARRMASFSSTDKAKAFQMASSIVKPVTPSFMVLMQRSYVITGASLSIPIHFVDQYFPEKNHGEINLLFSNDRTWHVKYRSRVSGYCRLVEFIGGWKEFMEENNLEVGDVCVFELIKGTKFSLKVTIIRFNEYASDNSEKMKLCETEESEDDFSLCKGEKTSLNCLRPYEIMRTGSKGTQVEGLTLMKPIKNLNTSSKHGLADNSRLLTYQGSSAEYSSEYPFFIRTMCGSYLEGNLRVPKTFAEKYIKKSSLSVHLQVAKESWIVQSRIYKNGSCKFCQWSSFAKANSLREGDVCIFELIKRNDMLFKVLITRYLDAQVKN